MNQYLSLLLAPNGPHGLQVKMHPHLFSVLHPFLTFIGPKKSIPVFVNGCSRSASRSLGKSAITSTLGSVLLLLQYRQSLTIFLASDFPWGIQNCWRTRAGVRCLPTCKCFSCRCLTTSFEIGCDGVRITWCFASNGMGALFRRPPTLITPPRKIGCSGSSELLWGSALLAWISS